MRSACASREAMQEGGGQLVDGLLVHDYVRVDRAILVGALRDALVDLRAFAGLAGQWLDPA